MVPRESVLFNPPPPFFFERQKHASALQNVCYNISPRACLAAFVGPAGERDGRCGVPTPAKTTPGGLQAWTCQWATGPPRARPVLRQWRARKWENVDLDGLMQELAAYDVIVFQQNFIPANTRDLRKYRDRWLAFLDRGGIVLAVEGQGTTRMRLIRDPRYLYDRA